MARKHILAAATVVISAGVHGIGFGVGSGKQPVELAGGAPEQVAMLGNSFADMAAGTVSPTSAAPDVATPVKPDQTEAKPVEPEVQKTPVKTTPTTPSPVQNQPAVQPSPSKVAPVEKPVQKPVAKPVPKERPKPRVEQPKRAEQPKPPAKSTPRGNSDQSGRKGQSDGRSGAKRETSGQANGSNAQAGNAAVSNYPGKVWRKLDRTRKRGRGRGKAIVGFTVAASGGVAKVWLVRSSGNANLDSAALKHVHRAAPFPPPPKGARRQYSFEYVGK